jgi:hypothetical protein
MMVAFGDFGCRYLVKDRWQCGARQQRGSSYCAKHHQLCHLVRDSAAERERLAEDAAHLQSLIRKENAEEARSAER